MNKNVHEGFENAMSKYKPEDSKDVVTSVIDNIQRTLECCGAKGPNDWQKFYVADAVPLSCCPPQSSMYTPCLADRTFAKGCILELDKVIKYNVVSLSFILFVVALLQLVAVSIACYLIQ
jgi:CD63 antigen